VVPEEKKFEFNIFLNSISGPTMGFFSIYLTIGKVRVIKK